MAKLAKRKLKLTRQKESIKTEGLTTEPQIIVVEKHSRKPSRLRKTMVHDLRTVFSPNSSQKLKSSGKNVIKDYKAISSVFGATHLLRIGSVNEQTVVELGKLKKGPTVSFEVLSFVNAKEVLKRAKKEVLPKDLLKPPLLVLNGFHPAPSDSGDQVFQKKLLKDLFQKMFPSVVLGEARIRNCRRVVLINYSPERLEIRHYKIQQDNLALSKGIRKLLHGRSHNLDVLRGVCSTTGSDSEMENEEIEIGSRKRVGIKLYEMGPNLDLKVLGGVSGLMTGDNLFYGISLVIQWFLFTLGSAVRTQGTFAWLHPRIGGHPRTHLSEGPTD